MILTNMLNYKSEIICLFLGGFFIRFFLINLSNNVENRVEFSTPLNSWKRAIEGVSLQKFNILPYDGDIFHESPVSLMMYGFILENMEKWISTLFVIADLVTAIILCLASEKYLSNLVKKEKEKTDFPASACSLLLTPDKVNHAPIYVAAVYLFCPFSIASCISKSTSVFSNVILAGMFYFTAAGKWFGTAVFIALASYLSFYPIMCIIPASMYISQVYKHKWRFTLTAISSVVVIVISALLYYSYKITNSWRFLWSTYGCILSVPDLAPNIGLFWYFFTEMFEHFRIFFLWTFQLNIFVYVVPLSVRLRREPMLFLFVMIILMATFKSYPCTGDVAFYLSLLPVWSHLFPYMRQNFLIGCIIISCTFLAPILWYLWIYAGSANANFYFGITLAFNTGQIFLLTDMIFAYVKRQYFLQHQVKKESFWNEFILI